MKGSTEPGEELAFSSFSMAEIRTFNAVVRSGSYVRAADDLGVSQPAVTAQIRKLDSRFNVPLLERVGRRFSLTELGKKVYSVTVQYSDLDASMRALMENQNQAHEQVLYLATASPRIFMPLVSAFKKSFPSVRINLISGSTNECRTLLANREVDIGMFPVDRHEPAYSSLSFQHHRLVAMLPIDHPLASEREVSVHSLVSHPLIFSRIPSYTQSYVDTVLAENNLSPKASFLMDSRFENCEAIAVGWVSGLLLKMMSGLMSASPMFRSRKPSVMWKSMWCG